jgi:hypothetical protein
MSRTLVSIFEKPTLAFKNDIRDISRSSHFLRTLLWRQLNLLFLKQHVIHYGSDMWSCWHVA